METLPDILEDLELALAVLDPETADIFFANEDMESLLGFTTSELKDMSIGQFSTEEFTDAKAVELIQSAAAGEPQEFEWQVQRPTGEFLWLQVWLHDTRIDGELYVIARAEDTTRFHVRERRMKLLQRITRHNLRTQVQLIQGIADDLPNSIGTSAHEDNIEKIQTAARNLLDLTSTIQSLKTVIEADKTRREAIHLQELITDTVETYRTEYPAVQWTIDCEDDLLVAADDGLSMALQEVLQNTVDHNPHEGLQVRVTVGQSADTGHALIRIEDNGRPIPQMEVEATRNTDDPDQINHGEGAGFWVMGAIIETLGGRLTIRRNDDFGNEVEFSLPQTDTPVTV